MSLKPVQPLMPHVADLLQRFGQGTCDTLLPHCPGYTRDQVMRALQALRYQRRINLLEAGWSGGKHGGALPAVYGPGDIDAEEDAPLPTCTHTRGDYGIPRVASVWQLGEASHV